MILVSRFQRKNTINDLNFIDKENLNTILSQIETCKKLLNGFINYYKKH